jgi:hypothetical protein
VVSRHTHDAVTHIAVQTDDVRVFVVHEIVRVLPLRRRACGVPFPLGGVDFGVVHPVPLAVNDVVAQLHVLDDLGGGQTGDTRQARDSAAAGEQRQAAEGREPALQLNCATDVLRIALAARFLDIGADRVEFCGQVLHVLGTEMRVCLDISDSHEMGSSHTLMVQLPDAVEMQVWIRSPALCS